jgi:hypothetical protein
MQGMARLTESLLLARSSSKVVRVVCEFD